VAVFDNLQRDKVSILYRTESIDFLNEEKLTTTQDDDSCLKVWNNKSGSMLQLLSSNIITEGTHSVTLQSVNDPGGYTVIGISDKETSDYYSSVSLAGNGFSSP